MVLECQPGVFNVRILGLFPDTGALYVSTLGSHRWADNWQSMNARVLDQRVDKGITSAEVSRSIMVYA